MRYECGLYVERTHRFTGVYRDADVAARDICNRAASLADFHVTPQALASDIERGALTVDLRLRVPHVCVEIRHLT